MLPWNNSRSLSGVLKFLPSPPESSPRWLPGINSFPFMYATFNCSAGGNVPPISPFPLMPFHCSVCHLFLFLFNPFIIFLHCISLTLSQDDFMFFFLFLLSVSHSFLFSVLHTSSQDLCRPAVNIHHEISNHTGTALRTGVNNSRTHRGRNLISVCFTVM